MDLNVLSREVDINLDKLPIERDWGLERRHARCSVSNFTCDIGSRSGLQEAKVENISRGGFKLSNLADGLQLEDFLYKAVIAGEGRYYKMMVRPCWQAEDHNGREIGFKILDVNWEWHEMIMQAELATEH